MSFYKMVLSNMILLVIVFGCLFWVIFSTMTMPDVHMSYSQNTCVRVINYDNTDFSCDNMPVKYNHIWIQ
jgi:hypothetical protein